MNFQVPASTLDPAGFQSRRTADNIAPAVAEQLQTVLANLGLGGQLSVGAEAKMPISQYYALGGPKDVPVYIFFPDQTSARNIADAFNSNGFKGGVSAAFAAFEQVQTTALVSVLMERFPTLRDKFYAELEAIVDPKNQAKVG